MIRFCATICNKQCNIKPNKTKLRFSFDSTSPSSRIEWFTIGNGSKWNCFRKLRRLINYPVNPWRTFFYSEKMQMVFLDCFFYFGELFSSPLNYKKFLSEMDPGGSVLGSKEVLVIQWSFQEPLKNLFSSQLEKKVLTVYRVLQDGHSGETLKKGPRYYSTTPSRTLFRKPRSLNYLKNP